MLVGTKSRKTVDDCLVAKFQRHRDLTGEEIAFLGGLQNGEEIVAPGRDIVVQGERSSFLYVLRSGWAISHKGLPNGRRQILEILLPGDVIGLRELAFGPALNYVSASTPIVVCPFERSRLREIFERFPGLAEVLTEIGVREQALLVERIVDIGSRSAYQRLAHLFMELLIRLRGCGLAQGTSFAMPLSQSVIGDALGLSRVHIARTLRELREAKLVEVARQRVTVLDEPGLIDAAEFEEFYLRLL